MCSRACSETIAIGEEGRLPTQVTHHKMIGRAAWGQSAESLRLVREARERGVDVTIDQYPYTASSTALAGGAAAGLGARGRGRGAPRGGSPIPRSARASSRS